MAAIAASVILTRIRVQDNDFVAHAGENQPIRVPLDALRAAGM